MASASDRNPIIIGGLPSQVPDFDPEETQEWLDSLDAAVDERGRERARYLMLRLIADGLWMSDLFGTHEVSLEQRKALLSLLTPGGMLTDGQAEVGA